MNILICDDSMEDAATLDALLKRSGYTVNTAIFTDGLAALDYMEAGKVVDVCILDIVMQGMDGVALAKELRNDGFTGAIVFLSASNDYGSESYSVRAFHYLLKPPSRESIKALLDMLARERDNADTAAIRLKSSGVVRSIRLRDVAYVEVIQHKVYFRLRQGGEIVVNSALKEYADELLRDARFVQCHRSYIVNMDEIKNSRNMEW